MTPFACANITMVHTTKVRNTLEDWYGDNTGGVVVGSVTLEQAIPFDRTKVSIEVLHHAASLQTISLHFLIVVGPRRPYEDC